MSISVSLFMKCTDCGMHDGESSAIGYDDGDKQHPAPDETRFL